MFQIVLIGCFGAIGAICRYSVGIWMDRNLGAAFQARAGETFPWGTLGVNVTGCFLLGALVFIGPEFMPPAYRNGVQIGLLGAFTTFSTFGYETLIQFQNGQWREGLANVGANVLLGLIAVWGGMVVGRAISHSA